MFRRGARVRPLRASALEPALALAQRDPLTNALGGARLVEVARAGALGREFQLTGDDARPEGILWDGVNLSPLSASAQALEHFGRYAAQRPRRCSSVVGPRGAVERLWGHLETVWDLEVREYRWSQPLLAAVDPSQLPVAGAPSAGSARAGSSSVGSASAGSSSVGLRPALPQEIDAVFPTAVAMFREEVGADPTRGDGGRGYRGRVAELIRTSRTYVVTETGPGGRPEVVFKADVGAVFGPVAQIHGVWVRPDRRGRGLGRAAMAELVPLVRRDHAPQVSLYVNDFNEPARRAYAAAGFRQVGELSTILF